MYRSVQRAGSFCVATGVLAWILGLVALPTLLAHPAVSHLPWWHDVELGRIHQARGLAWQIPASDSSSPTSAIQLFENGLPLAATHERSQVETTPGLFYRSREGNLWLSSRDGNDLATAGTVAARQTTSADLAVVMWVFLGLGMAIGLAALATLSMRWHSRMLESFVLAGVGFLIIHLVFQRIPLPAGSDRQGQLLDQLRKNRDQVEVVAIGSSHVLRHFDPEVFDQALPTSKGSSFNLGAQGMRMAEAVELAIRVLRMNPPNLRWIVIDSGEGSLESQNLETRRALRTRSPATATLALPDLLTRVANHEVPTPLLRDEMRTMSLGTLRAGEGGDWVRAWTGYLEPLRGVRGYESLDAALDAAGRRVRLELRGRRKELSEANYQQGRLRLKNRGERSGRLLDPLEIQLIRRLQRAAARHGVGIAYVVSPILSERANLRWAADLGEIDHLLMYNDPRRYPKLYWPNNRWDATHLNQRGARLFTRYLANDLRALSDLSD